MRKINSFLIIILIYIEEILEQKESSDFLSIYSDYEFINQSKNIKTIQPLHCRVIRDK